MAIKPYLQTASTEVTNALTDVETQFRTLQHDLNAEKSQLQTKLTGLEREHTTHMIGMTQAQDDSQKQALHQRAGVVAGQINDVKSRISQIDAQIARAQQTKNSMELSLRGAISQLSNLMGMPDLR